MVAENETTQPQPAEGSGQPTEMFHLKPREFPTMFGEIHERHVIFCIDTSGSMYNSLDVVREHLLESLLARAYEDRVTTFNLIEFASAVTQWSDRLVKCTPQTVAVAEQWLSKLAPTTGTNTNEALLTAFADINADAVYLVTDGVPDQSPAKVLDDVSNASRDRPVHCFYVQDGDADPVATTFLRDLAMETYGSFHVITVTQHGALERVTPVYRADTSAERIIRTTDGAIYPLNHQVCSLAPTLNTPLAVPVAAAVATPVLLPSPFPQFPYYHYPYYLPGQQCLYPNYGWSRYRPVHAQLSKRQHDYDASKEQVASSLAPGAGSLLIGTTVLARRNEDGYYYLASVKSQVMLEKFLIEFGPCRHGKFMETTYQETHIFDIISHVDALRHAISTGDRVIAPIQADGDKYAPGVVIRGQERRSAEGGVEDADLVISFNNGSTCSVARDTAVWIPPALHQRIAFEHQLPEKVRHSLKETESYPSLSLPGYPTTAVLAQPAAYTQFAPAWVERPTGAVTLYRYPPHSAGRPVYYTHKSRQAAVSADDIERLIPGTGVTKAQLDDKVMSQLVRHKMVLPDGRTAAPSGDQNETCTENVKKLEKSVTFGDPASGNSHSAELRESLRNSETNAGENETLNAEVSSDESDLSDTETRDIGVGTASSLLERRRSRNDGLKPPWRYWKNEPAPSVMESNHFGNYRLGPHEQAMPPVPLEAREPSLKQHNNVEWTRSMGQFVDPLAPHKYDTSVRDAFYTPRPPERLASRTQPPGREIGEVIGSHLTAQERRQEQRHNFRRVCGAEREAQLVAWRADADAAAAAGEGQRRLGIEHRLRADAERHAGELHSIEQQRQARSDVNREFQRQIEARSDREVTRAEQHMSALQKRRQRREEIIIARQHDINATAQRREAIRAHQTATRWNSVTDKLADESAKIAERDRTHRNAKSARIEHFQQLELAGQRRKKMSAAVDDQQTGICRAELLV